MVSEGVQTNGISSRHSTSSEQSSQISPPTKPSKMTSSIRPHHPVPQQQQQQQKQQQQQQQQQHPPLPPYTDPPAPPLKTTISPRLASQLPGYQLQIYHIDGDISSSNAQQTPAGKQNCQKFINYYCLQSYA